MQFLNKHARWLSFTVMCILLILPITSIVNADNTALTGELTILVNKSYEEMQPYADLFQKKYPGVSVNYIYLENYEQDALTYIESGDYGDVLFIPSSLSDLDCQKYFEPICSVSDYSQYYNYINQARTVRTQVYGMPSCAYISGFIYNKSVFEQAGITTLPDTPEEFLEALVCIESYTDATPLYTNYISEWALNVWEYFPYIEMTGNASYKENIFVNIKNPFSNDASHSTVYQLLYDIVEQGLCEKIGTGDWEASKKNLNEGNIGCMAIGSWALSQVKKAGSHSDDVAFMPFPYNINGLQYASINTDYSYAISKNSSNKELAKTYIEFMVNESGFALNNDTISIVKTDPLPDSYSDLENVTLLSIDPATEENLGKFGTLSSNLNLTDGTEQKRIIDAACGNSSESFDDIMSDWDSRWESSRTSDMTTTDENVFSNEYVTNEGYSVTFSELELDYIIKHDSLKVGYLQEFAPFQYEIDGSFTGISASFLEKISEMSGINFEYIPYDSYAKLAEALDKKDIDIAAGVEEASSYTDNMQLSKRYADYMLTIVKNNTVTMSDMESKCVASISDSGLDYFNNLENSVSSDSLPASIHAVSKANADYTILNYYSANYYISDKEYSNLNIIPLNNESGLHLGFSKNADTALIAICNKCIYAIPDGEMKLLLLENMDPPAKAVTISALIERYPHQFILAICIVFLIVILTFLWIVREKHHSAKKHELDAKRYQILANLSNEYMFEYNYINNVIGFDDKFTEEFEFKRIVRLDHYDHSSEQFNFFLKQFDEIKINNNITEKTFLFPHSNKPHTWYKMITAKIYDDKDEPIQIIGKLVNFQSEMNERLELLDKAEQDPLTGLLNREGFQSIYNNLSEKQTEGYYLLAILDFDNFKGVNDSLGHAGGDEALKLLAKQLTSIIDTHGITSRYGGDEFVLYLPEVTSVNTAENLIEQLVNSMNCSITFNGKKHSLSISLGAVLAPASMTYEEAFPLADGILYKVKENGKNNYMIKIV